MVKVALLLAVLGCGAALALTHKETYITPSAPNPSPPPTISCPEGQYLASGSSMCAACPNGRSSPTGSTSAAQPPMDYLLGRRPGRVGIHRKAVVPKTSLESSSEEEVVPALCSDSSDSETDRLKGQGKVARAVGAVAAVAAVMPWY